MNLVPPSFNAARRQERRRSADDTGMRWATLSDAADLVAALAGLDPERASPEVRNFPALMREAEAWRRERVEQGVADLAAMMEPGIAALLAVNARGADPQPAALALWSEFAAARRALLALLPPVPRRDI